MAKPTRSEMPFLDHLEELRWRLVRSIFALAIGMLLGFLIIWKLDLLPYLEKPIQPYIPGGKLNYTHPTDPFSAYLQASFIFGLILALPVILYQIWGFLAPALHQHEKRVVLPVIFSAVFL